MSTLLQPDGKQRSRQPQSDRKRANDLDGRAWVRNSISIWRDIKRNDEERRLKHPAMFPIALVERLIECFTKGGSRTVLDPFCGSGSTLIATRNLHGHAIGIELSQEYFDLTRKRLGQGDMFASDQEPELFQDDARRLDKYVDEGSVDLCITSPPYWNILSQKRTADYKDVRDYGGFVDNLGDIDDYTAFLSELSKVWIRVYDALKPGGYFVVNVMDLRKGPKFIPLHMDIANNVAAAGFIFDDTIIWDRSAEYNNLRALGYPAVFRINKVHEFLLIFQKPR